MSFFEHHTFDSSIPDPSNPEHMIEDPIHGESSRIMQSMITPMPTRSGLWYNFGRDSMRQSPYTDDEGNDVMLIRSGTTPDFMREVFDLQEWVTAFHEGDDMDAVGEELREKFATERAKAIEAARAKIETLTIDIPLYEIDESVVMGQPIEPDV